jgi:hypothetical protein
MALRSHSGFSTGCPIPFHILETSSVPTIIVPSRNLGNSLCRAFQYCSTSGVHVCPSVISKIHSNNFPDSRAGPMRFFSVSSSARIAFQTSASQVQSSTALSSATEVIRLVAKIFLSTKVCPREFPLLVSELENFFNLFALPLSQNFQISVSAKNDSSPWSPRRSFTISVSRSSDFERITEKRTHC